MTSERLREKTGEEIREETLGEVSIPAHWVYMLVTLGGGFLAMVVLIALLGSGSQ